MKNRTLTIQFLCPDIDEGGDLRIVVIYDPRNARDLTGRLSPGDCERLAALLKPCLRKEGKT